MTGTQKFLLWLSIAIIIGVIIDRYIQLKQAELYTKNLMLQNANKLIQNQSELKQNKSTQIPMRPIGFRRSSEDDIA